MSLKPPRYHEPLFRIAPLHEPILAYTARIGEMADGDRLRLWTTCPANNAQRRLPPSPLRRKQHPQHPARHSTANRLRSASPVTPVNLILLSLFACLVYLRLKPAKPQTLPQAPPPTVFRTFTPPELSPYNGLNGMPVYLAVRGRVFDVTAGRNFYGPGGPYANFAGRDASRGLAHGSFDEDMLTKDLEGPLDKLEDLEEDQMEALQGWEERFLEKYLVVGKLVSVGSEEANAAAAQQSSGKPT